MRYSATFEIDTNGVVIQRGIAGGNEIPLDIFVRSLVIVPTPSDGTFPDYYIKGTHPQSEWVLVPKESPIHRESGLSNRSPILEVKAASGTITMNLFVDGD